MKRSTWEAVDTLLMNLITASEDMTGENVPLYGEPRLKPTDRAELARGFGQLLRDLLKEEEGIESND